MNHRKKVLWMQQISFGIAIALCGTFGWAANEAMGSVNVGRVLGESASGTRAAKKLEKEFSGREQELVRMNKQFQDLQASLSNGKFSESEKLKKEQAIRTLGSDLERKQRDFKEDLNRRRNEELGNLQERANQVIKKIASAEHLDLIVQDAAYSSPKMDITDRVIKELDKDVKR